MDRQDRRTLRRLAPLAALVIFASLWGGIQAAPPGAADPADEKAGKGPHPAEQTQLGWVLVQTPEPARVFTPHSLRGVTFEKVHVTGQAPFELRPQRTPTASVCAANACAETGDFDILFYRERADGSAVVVTRHSEFGPEEGRVPANANFAFVFLRTSATQPDARGSGFVYLEGHPGGDALPQWP
jgi:hypothetical protein